MVLLQIDAVGIGVFPFERDTPGSVDVERIALGASAKSMEVETRHAKLTQRDRLIQSVEPKQAAAVEIGADLGAPAVQEELFETLVAEAPDHAPTVTQRVTGVNARSREQPAEVAGLPRCHASRQEDGSGQVKKAWHLFRVPHISRALLQHFEYVSI